MSTNQSYAILKFKLSKKTQEKLIINDTLIWAYPDKFLSNATYNILECELNCISNIGPTEHDTSTLLYLDNKYCKITYLL